MGTVPKNPELKRLLQLLIHQRQQFIGRFWVALLGSLENSRDIAHACRVRTRLMLYHPNSAGGKYARKSGIPRTLSGLPPHSMFSRAPPAATEKV